MRTSRLSLEDINTMEREFLIGMGWGLGCSAEEFAKWKMVVKALGSESLKMKKSRAQA